MNLIEPVKKVIAESPGAHALLKITISGSNNAHIHRNFSQATQSIVRSAIKYAQQLDLSLWLQLTDFIKKQRTSICQLEESRLSHIGSAEGALFVAEQFAL